MPAEQPSIEDFWSSGRWFVHNVDLTGRMQVVRVDANDLERSTFLDKRMMVAGNHEKFALDIEDIARSMPAQVPARGNYICHLSHVGSTLVSKVLGVPKSVVGLREPVLLRWLAAMQATAGEAESLTSLERYQRNLKLGIALLNRPFEGREHLLIKATSYANPVILDALGIQPEARILGLFTPIENFAATILKKRGGWMDVLNLAPQRLKRLHAVIGTRKWQLSGMSPGELAGMSWLAEMASLNQIHRKAGDRFRWIDFETFLADPDARLPEMCSHFGIEWAREDEERFNASGLMGLHSKRKRAAYSAQDRAAELAKVHAEQADEIARAVQWVRAALAEHPGLLAQHLWPQT